jgi:ankyrin repeat protein
VVALLAHKVAVYPKNKDGRTALHLASAGLHRKVVEALLATQPIVRVSSAGDGHGVEVNGRDGTGRTPLMLTADNEGFVPDDVMELLLNKGGEIDAQDPEGNTALIISIKVANFSGVEFLVNKGASVNLKNKAGETALTVARRIHEQWIDQAKFIEEMIVSILLKAGAKE